MVAAGGRAKGEAEGRAREAEEREMVVGEGRGREAEGRAKGVEEAKERGEEAKARGVWEGRARGEEGRGWAGVVRETEAGALAGTAGCKGRGV